MRECGRIPYSCKELWAIVSSLAKWRSWLSGHPVEVHTDHQGLQYFETKPKLNARQARWQQDMAEFDIVVKYKPESAMVKPDALSRKTGNSKEGLESQFFPDGTFLGRDHADEALDMDSPDPDIGADISSWERN